MKEQSAFPLAWPVGWPRTKAVDREGGSFTGTFDRVRRELLTEIDRIALGSKQAGRWTIKEHVVISTNLPLRKDGFPMSDNRRLDDPGVAVYFRRKEQPVCFACDKYDAVWKNMRAVQRTIEALRGIERWGSSQLLDRAFTGFLALPAPGTNSPKNCWTALGIAPGSSREQIESAYRALAKIHHPDREGSSVIMAEINDARNAAHAANLGGKA